MAFKDQDGVFAWLESGEGKGLIPLDRGILLTLARYINSGTGLSYPGTERLARLWGVSRRAVEKSLARLRQAGLVVVAQRATGQRYARYRIILAESSPHPGVDYSEEVAHTQRSSSPHSGVKKPTLRGGRISESSLSQSEVMTTPSDDDASLTGVTASAKPSDWVSDPVFGEVAGTLGLDEQATRSWITDRLGRAAGPVRNRDSYIRTALEHNRADVARGKKKAATRMTPREALDRIAELAGAEVVVHGNEAEVEVCR
jgi:biotin operon repressor